MCEITARSLAQLHRYFLRDVNASPMDFAIRARIEYAKHLLRESTLPLLEISELLSYQDHAYFSRQFKKFTSRSPLAYRNGK
jgi:AraC-like DNA-binding protein